ncbi:MAG: sugar ABC transporter permease [Spirochaetaceae bacterium]|nr:sugar ABC transporter permease [Spirochaetaceae bacterium]
MVGRVDLARKKARMGYLFTLPLMVGIVLFLIMPIVQSISFSVGEIELTEEGYLLHPVGLANFHHVLRVDTFFPRHLAAAVVKLASEVPVVLVFGLICASLLNRPFRGRGVMRTILFLPVILSSGVLVTLQQSYLLTQELDIGTLFERFTRQMVSGWVVESAAVDGALSYIVDATARLPGIAAAAGIPILIFLAGLQGIPDSMYEVARIEGANAWESFFYITVPLAAPLIFPIVVYMIVDSFTAADSELLRYITQSMQSGAGYGASTAMAWVFFGSVAIILAIVGAAVARWTRNSGVVA